jgi:hemolysin activation/secretion protein
LQIRTHRYSVLLAGCLTILAPAAPAQPPPTPGAVRETLPEPRELPRETPTPSVETPAAPTPGAVPPGGPTILIERFELRGNSVISTEELLSVIDEYRGRRLTLLEIYGVADILTNYYRSRGYALATVTVPAQEVTSGVVVLEVIEGRVGAINFEGNRRYRASMLERYLDRIDPGDVLVTRTLEQELAELNRLPGLSTRAVVTPGVDYGTSDVVIRSEERLLQGGLRLNNFGRRSVGEMRIEGDFIINNPFGWGDRAGVTALNSESGLLTSVRADYDAPIGIRGTRVGVYYGTYDYDVATSELGPAFRGTVLEGDGEDFGLTVTHPLWSAPERSLTLGAGLNRSLTHQEGTLVLPERERNDMSLLVLSAEYAHLHRNNSYSVARLEFAGNFDGNDDGLEKNAQAGKFRLDAYHFVRPAPGWLVQLRGIGVVSIDPLNDIEQFRLGGRRSVRGYPDAELAGDDGLMLSVEVQRSFQIGRYFPSAARLFYDGGFVHLKEPQFGEEEDESVQGAGIGLRAQLHRYVELDFEFVHPIGRREASDRRDGVRVWGGLTARF